MHMAMYWVTWIAAADQTRVNEQPLAQPTSAPLIGYADDETKSCLVF